MTTLRELKLSHLRQLQSYVHSRDESSWYYGKKEQFEKRHKDLVKWIDSVVDQSSNVQADCRHIRWFTCKCGKQVCAKCGCEYDEKATS